MWRVSPSTTNLLRDSGDSSNNSEVKLRHWESSVFWVFLNPPKKKSKFELAPAKSTRRSFTWFLEIPRQKLKSSWRQPSPPEEVSRDFWKSHDKNWKVVGASQLRFNVYHALAPANSVSMFITRWPQPTPFQWLSCVGPYQLRFIVCK